MKDFLITRLMADESGATAIEYAIIAAGIAAVIVGAVNMLGTSVLGLYTTVVADFGSAG